MGKICCITLLLIMHHNLIFSQPLPVNSQQFFLSEEPVEVILTTNIRKLKNDKKTPVYQPATITFQFSDTSIITEAIRVKPRGNYRKEHCNLASLMLNFTNTTSPLLSPLRRLKLVGTCQNGSFYDELLLKEYLVYKIQNMLSSMSFRVRLLHITYKDSEQKVKPFGQHAFLIEDIRDLAERNNCVICTRKNFYTEATNREQMTFVNLFQYMIGNTDWSVPNLHNIKLISPKNDALAKPYVIPYDYDFCGLVNAGYAEPAEGLGIESVRQRLYRGFSRGVDELQASINGFQEKKERIMYYVDHFEFCSTRCRKLMESYIDEFYKIVTNKDDIKSIFILSARNE